MPQTYSNFIISSFPEESRGCVAFLLKHPVVRRWKIFNLVPKGQRDDIGKRHFTVQYFSESFITILIFLVGFVISMLAIF